MTKSRHMTLLFLVFLMVFTSDNAFSCESIRLDKTTMKTQPVLNQEETGLCYAYVAAQLVDAYRFSKASPPQSISRTSPIGSAVRTYFNDGNLKSIVQTGGYSEKVIEKIRSTGSCREDVISGSYSVSDVASIFRDTFLVRETTEANTCDHCKNSNISMWRYALKEMIDPINDLISTYQSWQTLKNIERLCKTSSADVNVPEPRVQKVEEIPDFQNSPGVASSLIDSVLSKSQPVGIYYCPMLFENEFLKTRGFCKNQHASIIVGSRKRDNDRCEYLIRNSYGENWGENGQAWVKEEALISNTSTFIWLEQ